MSKTTKAIRRERDEPLFFKPKRGAVTHKEKLHEQLHKDSSYTPITRPERDDALFLQSNIRM